MAVPSKQFSQRKRRERGQDIAEYAVMLAVIVIIVLGTLKIIGKSGSSPSPNSGSTLQQ